ncbi:glycosyltransferase family 4 protein [Streptomyces sp. NPDC055992]|uniref:glycosyltransferase family 4 protein n=1 Tax=Streptomyces sp. NPDC055992 TaxID=3345673 RepID=UPI0035D7F374
MAVDPHCSRLVATDAVSLQRHPGAGRAATATASPTQPKIAVALHDGFYGCTSGTGFSNRSFLDVLARAMPPGRLLVMPLEIPPSDPSYDPAWVADTERLVKRAEANVVPIPGGRTATFSVAGCEALCESAMQVAREHLDQAPDTQLIGLDIPFLGLALQRHFEDQFSLFLVPRSTSELATPEDQRRVRWERKGLAAAASSGARIAAISSHMHHHLAQDYGIPGDTLVDLPNGLILGDLQETPIAPLPTGAKAGFILAMGRAVASKGFEDLLEALEILAARGVEAPHLILAPSTHAEALTTYQKKLQAMVRDYTIDATFLPRFSPQYRSWLRSPALRAVVVPSRTEPFGRIPLEAFAAGAAPVVATQAGGLAETVIDGITGFTARPCDPESLADAIGNALRVSSRDRDRIRTQSQDLLATRHDYEATIRSYLLLHAPWALAPGGAEEARV